MSRWGAIAVLASLTALSACGSDDSEDEGGSVGDDTSAVVDVLPDGVPDDVQPDKVLLAAVLLAAGDVDTALSEGLVTAEEVDRAAEALDAGTLNDWMDRAEEAD
jgi:hypothetical protein